MAYSKKQKLLSLFISHIHKIGYYENKKILYNLGTREWEKPWDKKDKGNFEDFDFVFSTPLDRITICVVDFLDSKQTFKDGIKNLNKKLDNVSLQLGFFFDGQDFYMINKGSGQFIKEFPTPNILSNIRTSKG